MIMKVCAKQVSNIKKGKKFVPQILQLGLERAHVSTTLDS